MSVLMWAVQTVAMLVEIAVATMADKKVEQLAAVKVPSRVVSKVVQKVAKTAVVRALSRAGLTVEWSAHLLVELWGFATVGWMVDSMVSH